MSAQYSPPRGVEFRIPPPETQEIRELRAMLVQMAERITALEKHVSRKEQTMDSTNSEQRVYLQDPNNPGALFPVYTQQEKAIMAFHKHAAVMLLAMWDQLEREADSTEELAAVFYMTDVAGRPPTEK